MCVINEVEEGIYVNSDGSSRGEGELIEARRKGIVWDVSYAGV